MEDAWERAVAIAAEETAAAAGAVRQAAVHAVAAGMALAWLHTRESTGHGGDRRGDGRDRRSFQAVLASIGLARSQAYRWMNAYAAAAARAGLAPADLPEPGHIEWVRRGRRLAQSVSGTSLRRLLLGAAREGSEEHRLEELVDRAEHDDQAAAAALERVADGELTLVQAMRAAAGAAATKGKSRRDPVYLALDGRTGGLRGLLPRCLVTLNNAFTRWEDLEAPARRKFLAAWKELVSHLPEDLA